MGQSHLIPAAWLIMLIITFVLLLSFPKTRKVAAILLSTIFVLLIIGIFAWRVSEVSEFSHAVPMEQFDFLQPAVQISPTNDGNSTISVSVPNVAKENQIVGQSASFNQWPIESQTPSLAAATSTRPTWFAFGIRAVFGLLLLGGLAFTVAMLSIPKTRTLGIVLLVVGSIIILPMIAGYFLVGSYSTPTAIQIPGNQSAWSTPIRPPGSDIPLPPGYTAQAPTAKHSKSQQQTPTPNSKQLINAYESAIQYYTKAISLPLSEDIKDDLKEKVSTLKINVQDLGQVTISGSSFLINSIGQALAKAMTDSMKEKDTQADINPSTTPIYNSTAAQVSQNKLPRTQAGSENKQPSNQSPADKASPTDSASLQKEIERCIRALSKNPNDAVAHYHLGNALTKAGRLPEAEGDYIQALNLMPNYPEAHNGLGKLLMQRNRANEAIEHFKKALRLKPDYTEARKSLEIALANAGVIAEPENANSTESDQDSPVKIAKETSSDQKPDWVEKPPRRVGNSYQMSVTTGPYSTLMECERKIPDLLKSAVDQYLEASGRQWVGLLRLPPEKLRQLIADQWEETRQYSVGMMTQIHLLLSFDQKAKELIDDAIVSQLFANRASVAGTGFIGLWLLLAVVWGYLKLDLATKGAHRTRLRVTATLATLTIAWVIVAVLRSLA